MTHNFRCSNEEEHTFHPFVLNTVKDCNGQTFCGEVVHEPHTIPVDVDVWCPGVCLCGDTYRGPHGPGDHK